jgi:hypothetical protein
MERENGNRTPTVQPEMRNAGGILVEKRKGNITFESQG